MDHDINAVDKLEQARSKERMMFGLDDSTGKFNIVDVDNAGLMATRGYVWDSSALAWKAANGVVVDVGGNLYVGGVSKIQDGDGSDLAAVVTGSNTGVKGLRVYGGPTDPISDLPVTIPYDHHQVHEGETWHWDVLISNLASGVSRDIVFTVPTITPAPGESIIVRCPHFRYTAEVNDLCNVFLYEGPTVTAATGTAQTPINFERNGTYTPKLQILDAPTITAVGTLIDAEYFINAGVGAVSSGGVASAVNEFVLKSGTKYLFRVTSGAAGCDIHADFHWYEDLGV